MYNIINIKLNIKRNAWIHLTSFEKQNKTNMNVESKI